MFIDILTEVRLKNFTSVHEWLMIVREWLVMDGVDNIRQNEI